jgi:hypothetical protein
MSPEPPGGNAVLVEATACGKGEGQVLGRAYFRKGSSRVAGHDIYGAEKLS